jgi:hypothetical protein
MAKGKYYPPEFKEQAVNRPGGDEAEGLRGLRRAPLVPETVSSWSWTRFVSSAGGDVPGGSPPYRLTRPRGATQPMGCSCPVPGPGRRDNHISTRPSVTLPACSARAPSAAQMAAPGAITSAARDRGAGLRPAVITRPGGRGSRRVTMSHACSAV